MTIRELIAELEELIEGGQNPESRVLIFSWTTGKMEEVTGANTSGHDDPISLEAYEPRPDFDWMNR